MKANLDYVIRSVTAPGEAEPSLVPVIVNRIPSIRSFGLIVLLTFRTDPSKRLIPFVER